MQHDGWEAMLEAERLRLSSPEVVYEWLAALPASNNSLLGNCADGIVTTLLAREVPLIDLGLARFTANYQLLKPLWDKGGLVRTALLANRAHGPLFPTSNFYSAGDADPLRPIIEDMPEHDVAALYSNPKCPAALLDQTFRNTLGLSEERHHLACLFAVRNERLRTTLRQDTFDEFTRSLEHAKPIHAVWDLVRTAPVDGRWAQVLISTGDIVFELGLPKEFTPDLSTEEGRADWKGTWQQRNDAYRRVIFEAAETRWLGPEAERGDQYGSFLWARAAFAEAVCRSRPHNPEIKSDHPDAGFRKGFYRAAAIYPEWDIEVMYARDGKIFLDGITWNDSLYERGNTQAQRAVRTFALKSEDDAYIHWMKGRLAALTAKDPDLYGDQPTDEMVEEMRKREARAAAADEARRQREEREAARAAASPPKKGWKLFG